jgi:hypothetical protein
MLSSEARRTVTTAALCITAVPAPVLVVATITALPVGVAEASQAQGDLLGTTASPWLVPYRCPRDDPNGGTGNNTQDLCRWKLGGQWQGRRSNVHWSCGGRLGGQLKLEQHGEMRTWLVMLSPVARISLLVPPSVLVNNLSSFFFFDSFTIRKCFRNHFSCLHGNGQRVSR